ncbi:MAG: energy transducer TonB, partial [Treponema sp.]|nr:energy transducer TonB [Treponema sp.]
AFPSDRREPPDAAPEVSAAAPEAPVQAAAPDREAPPVAAAVPEAPAPAGAAGDEAAEIPAATENAAVPGDAGSAAGNAAAGYLALIMRRLEEKKVYPFSVRKRGIEGDVTVDFTIGPNGTVAGVTLVDSDHRFLSQAAAETIRSASPFPALPARVNTIPYPVRVTIRYRLEESEAER